jgi:hypothetical protein
MHLKISIFLFILLIQYATSLHLTGTFKTKDFFKFLTRFGFQSTDIHNIDSTQGYIYGNITLTTSTTSTLPLLALTILEKSDFLDYYKKTIIKPRDYACSIMFEKLNKQSYDSTCNPNGTLDITRKIPCEQTCQNQYQNQLNIDYSQFSYQISDANEAKFLYLSIVACERDNSTCSWYSSIDIDYEITYSIYLTNGHPSVKSQFKHHFTYELFDVFEIYLCSMLVYIFILPFILYRLHKHFHLFYLLLSSYIVIEIIGRFMFVLHNLVYSFNGVGVPLFGCFGWFFEIFALCILIFILLLIAKGYTITTKYIKMKRQFIIYWSVLSLCSIVSHMIALYSFNIIFHTNYYETYAGYVELCIRILFMVWFLKELKRTFSYINSIRTASSGKKLINSDESGGGNKSVVGGGSSGDDVEIEFISAISTSILSSNRLNVFYLHFGACSLVWFIYLPILVFIAVFVSDLFRFRLMISM